MKISKGGAAGGSRSTLCLGKAGGVLQPTRVSMQDAAVLPQVGLSLVPGCFSHLSQTGSCCLRKDGLSVPGGPGWQEGLLECGELRSSRSRRSGPLRTQPGSARTSRSIKVHLLQHQGKLSHGALHELSFPRSAFPCCSAHKSLLVPDKYHGRLHVPTGYCRGSCQHKPPTPA